MQTMFEFGDRIRMVFDKGKAARIESCCYCSKPFVLI